MNKYRLQRIIYFIAYMIGFMAIGGIYGMKAVTLTLLVLLSITLADRTYIKENEERK